MLLHRQSGFAVGSGAEVGSGLSGEVIATLLTGAVVLVAVWRMVESVRRDVRGEIRELRGEIGELRRDLTGQISEVNKRIDAVLLADRDARRAS